MTYWRMQLHPNEAGGSAAYTTSSLSAGFVGLDFATDIGDMARADRNEIPKNEKRQLAFYDKMSVGDIVLVFVHNFPFALARIAGPYNYIREPVHQIGVWFRHFRKVDQVRYYSDFRKDVRKWEAIPMTEALTPLKNDGTKSLELISEWIRSLE